MNYELEKRTLDSREVCITPESFAKLPTKLHYEHSRMELGIIKTLEAVNAVRFLKTTF